MLIGVEGQPHGDFVNYVDIVMDLERWSCCAGHFWSIMSGPSSIFGSDNTACRESFGIVCCTLHFSIRRGLQCLNSPSILLHTII